MYRIFKRNPLKNPVSGMKNEKGFSLIEVLVCCALVGIVGVAILISLGTASKILIVADQHETAKNLAETQMEFVKDLSYSSTTYPAYYPTIPTAVSDYPQFDVSTVAVHVPNRGAEIQKVTVTITHHLEGKVIFVLEDYKLK